MTVSRVVNGNTRVGADISARVKAAIIDLNYEANLTARSARAGTMRIGLLLSHPSLAFMNEFLAGAKHHCIECGAHLIWEYGADAPSQADAIGRLIDNGAQGILLPPPLCDQTSTLAQLEGIGIPIVAVASARPAPGTSAVRIDDYDGALALMRHLFSLGHRDIAFIKGDPSHTAAQLRYQAYRDAMAAAGLSVQRGRVADGLFTYRSGMAAARQLLDQQSRPSAVFACNDDMAVAVIAVAHGIGLRIPHELAVCGFDDTPIATAVWPELSTIHQPIGDMARAAVEMLIEEIRRSKARVPPLALHRVLPYTLVTREATDVRAANRRVA